MRGRYRRLQWPLQGSLMNGRIGADSGIHFEGGIWGPRAFVSQAAKLLLPSFHTPCVHRLLTLALSPSSHVD